MLSEWSICFLALTSTCVPCFGLTYPPIVKVCRRFAHAEMSQHAAVQGVAAGLVDAAIQRARKNGVIHLYVHVVHDNLAARKLYERCGFDVEEEEAADAARKRQHSRRLLLGLPLS
jgi:GNAT superfamily N-acetyltransferase